MNAIVTGANGTLGRVLRETLQAAGHQVHVWDRTKIPLDNYNAMESWILSTGADTIFHLAIASQPTGRDNEGWLVNYHWPSELAWISRIHQLRLLFTSTAMVFTSRARGPFFPHHLPDEVEGYGGEKARAELRILSQYPETKVVRLGWQIGEAPGSNNMIDYFERHMREQGIVRASERWLPACSLLPDTAEALVGALDLPGGTYHLDGNRSGFSFHQIAVALNARHGGRWNVQPSQDFVYDQRLLDDRLPVRSIADSLPLSDPRGTTT
jgi:dTDP-4-dehydrorhamnose reductase